MRVTASSEDLLEYKPETPKLYDEPPPAFGHAMYKVFGFDPEYVNLNHGSYGSLPLPVKSVCDDLTTKIERSPDRFLRFMYQPILVQARERVAKLIGAETDECVFVPNASHGINNVLHSFDWNAGDILVGASTTYGSISRTIQYLADIHPHISVSTFVLEFPTTHAAILSSFREHLHNLVHDSVPSLSNLSLNPKSGRSERKVVAVIDGIISNPGALLPWQEMVRICEEEGVWSVIDAAHCIGQELNINLTETKPDFWISNCHKWLYSKRSCCILYVPKRNQHIIKSCFPTSHEYVSPADPPNANAPTWIEQFAWNGTIDFVPFLSVNAALDFRNWLGGEAKINEYCHSLALEGGKRLAELFGTSLLDESGEVTLNMVNVELPIPGSIKWAREIDLTLQRTLLFHWNVYAAHFYHNGKWWTRCSAQVWNEIGDFEYLAKAFSSVCADIVKDRGGEA